MEALLRRATPTTPAADRVLRFGDVEVDAGARTVRRRGRLVELAPKELDLLLALLNSRGAAVSRVVSRTVGTHVAELRRKLGRHAVGAAPRPHCAEGRVPTAGLTSIAFVTGVTFLGG